MPAIEELLTDALGYLNFSGGQPDPVFQRNLSLLESASGCCMNGQLPQLLRQRLEELQRSSPAFSDSQQAERVIGLVADSVLPAYREFHADLLFHLKEEDFRHPYFLARVFEAVLLQGGPWSERERITTSAVAHLNDFLGYRPVAVLENGRLSQAWPQESHRPVPLWLKGAGVAAGPWEELIGRAIGLLESTPRQVLRAAWFDPDRLDELAVDMRAHDHLHPVSKRTNYMFGEWDPGLIDRSGYYRRFVVRRIILDALLGWIQQAEGIPRDEALDDAASVLCGTMLMASAISGEGPNTFDSTATLSSLLPQVARQRDEFYGRLLMEAEGGRARRLRREAKLTQQPFGHVRQQLNLELAAFGARQMQNRNLASLFARMGFREEARHRAAAIPSPAARFECEIQWRLATAIQAVTEARLDEAWQLMQEARTLLERGIECGAIVDPWNILGFQAQFPLFISREDSVPDQRVESLLGMMEQFFSCASHALIEAAATGQNEMRDRFSDWFASLADWWDRFATSTVEDLPQVAGRESWESARHVAAAMSAWQNGGQSTGDISFWREHSAAFQSPQAYARVVTALLDRGDPVASLGLMMQWLSEAENIGLESGPMSIYGLLLRWMRLAGGNGERDNGTEDAWKSIRRMFELLEANAGIFWSVPSLAESLGDIPAIHEEAGSFGEPGTERPGDAVEGDDFDDELEDGQDEVFGAAWDDVTYQDSTDDGNEGDTLDEGFRPATSDLDIIARYLEPRLRFLATLADLWQNAVARFAVQQPDWSELPAAELRERRESMNAWRDRVRSLQRGLSALLKQLQQHDIGASSGEFSENLEFDIQLQTRLYLLHRMISTTLQLNDAERFLDCCLSSSPEELKVASGAAELSLPGGGPQPEPVVARVYRAMFRRDVIAIRQEFPALLKRLRGLPLLYVSLENGGDPSEVMAVRFRQRMIRFLLAQLPPLGLFRETWQLLETAFQMERRSRPRGVAVTEFDRLFRIALESSLTSVVRSSGAWQPGGNSVPRRPLGSRPAVCPRRPRNSRRSTDTAPAGPMRLRQGTSLPTSDRDTRGQATWQRQAPGVRPQPVRRKLAAPLARSRRQTVAGFSSRSMAGLKSGSRELLELFGEIVGRFETQWQRHSRTVRLSSAEELRPARVWDSVVEFIELYGADLFHPRMLTLGNVRAILHNGIEEFLRHLEATADPLHEIALIEALQSGEISLDDAVETMDLIYNVIVDRFDRFFEYNTTTTQSDYGEKLYCLLDMLRVEAACERDAWNLLPVSIAHEVLTRAGRTFEARIWEEHVEETTRDRADRHARQLEKVEKKHGMQLPAVRDHLRERFVRPLAINRMLALVPLAVEEHRTGRSPSRSFEQLRAEIDLCLDTATGSGVDIPDWLRRLQAEVMRVEAATADAEAEDSGIRLPAPVLRPGQLRRELWLWAHGGAASG